MTERNWARNVEYGTDVVSRPASLGELQDVVGSAVERGRRVHALGSRHSFNRIADTDGVLVSMDAMARIVAIDGDAREVTVEGGARLGEIAVALHHAGWALHNLPSLPHITVAGAVATGTHGSGDRNGSLSTAIGAVDLVTATGDVVPITRASFGDEFAGVPVGLGALGVAARMTLHIEPTFDVAQTVYREVAIERVIDHLDEVMGSCYSVSLLTDWQGGTVQQIWCKRRLGVDPPAPSEILGGQPADVALHPVEWVSAEACTEQFGRPGPWHERLPHFRLEFTPSVGDELQTEYFVDRSDGPDALHAVAGLADVLAPLLLVSEIRSVAADELWLSPAQGRPSLAFHFTWRPDQPGVAAVLSRLEEALAPFAPRPHWGKLTSMPPDVIRSQYPRFDEFAGLARRLDPSGAFRNPYLDDLFG